MSSGLKRHCFCGLSATCRIYSRQVTKRICAPETFGRAAQPRSWKQFPDGWAMPWATHLRLNSAEPVTDSVSQTCSNSSQA